MGLIRERFVRLGGVVAQGEPPVGCAGGNTRCVTAMQAR
jgi:hypothetical protein